MLASAKYICYKKRTPSTLHNGVRVKRRREHVVVQDRSASLVDGPEPQGIPGTRRHHGSRGGAEPHRQGLGSLARAGAQAGTAAMTRCVPLPYAGSGTQSPRFILLNKISSGRSLFFV